MTQDNEFQSTLFRSRRERNQAVAYEWMTAGGLNETDEISAYCADNSPAKAADECCQTWNLLNTGDEELDQFDSDGDPRFTRAEIVEAFRYFYATRPDREDAE